MSKFLGSSVLCALIGAVLVGCGPSAESLARADAEKQQRIANKRSAERTTGVEAFQSGDVELAEAFLSAAWNRDSTDFEAGYLLALTFQRMGEFGKSFKLLNQLIDEASPKSIVRVDRLYAEVAISLGRLDEAEDFLKERIDENEKDLHLQNLLHRVFIEQQKYAEVLREARKVLKKDETNTGAMRNLALTYQRTKRLEQARYIAARALELEGENIANLVLVANIHRSMDKRDKALQFLEKAIEVAPGNPMIQNALAVEYLRVGDYSNAATQLQETIRIAPGLVEARINLANALRGLKDYQSAARTYEEALKLSPRLVDAHYNLGILYLQTDVDSQGEIERYRRALREFEAFREQNGMANASGIENLINESNGLIRIAVERREQALKAEENLGEEEGDFEDDDEE